MDIQSEIMLITGAYKGACLLAGLLCVYLGYRLFLAGIWGKAGDFETSYKDTRVVLTGAAPGTFFAFLGAGIMIATIWSGLNIGYDGPGAGSGGSKPTLPAPKQAGSGGDGASP